MKNGTFVSFFIDGTHSLRFQFEVITAVVWVSEILLISAISFRRYGPHLGVWYAWMIPTFHLVPWLAAFDIWRDTSGAKSPDEIHSNAEKRAMLVVLMRFIYLPLIVIEWTFLQFYR